MFVCLFLFVCLFVHVCLFCLFMFVYLLFIPPENTKLFLISTQFTPFKCFMVVNNVEVFLSQILTDLSGRRKEREKERKKEKK